MNEKKRIKVEWCIGRDQNKHPKPFTRSFCFPLPSPCSVRLIFGDHFLLCVVGHVRTLYTSQQFLRCLHPHTHTMHFFFCSHPHTSFVPFSIILFFVSFSHDCIALKSRTHALHNWYCLMFYLQFSFEPFHVFFFYNSTKIYLVSGTLFPFWLHHRHHKRPPPRTPSSSSRCFSTLEHNKSFVRNELSSRQTANKRRKVATK